MRNRGWIIGFALAGLLCAQAHADHRPTYVVPGHRGVPVIIDGVDASYAIVEGDWGLSRPGHGAPIVYGPMRLPPQYRGRYYFPYTGRRPRYGRREVIPPAHRVLPPVAESYLRVWSTPPDPGVTAPLYRPSYALPPIERPALRRNN